MPDDLLLELDAIIQALERWRAKVHGELAAGASPACAPEPTSMPAVLDRVPEVGDAVLVHLGDGNKPCLGWVAGTGGEWGAVRVIYAVSRMPRMDTLTMEQAWLTYRATGEGRGWVWPPRAGRTT